MAKLLLPILLATAVLSYVAVATAGVVVSNADSTERKQVGVFLCYDQYDFECSTTVKRFDLACQKVVSSGPLK